MLTRASFDYAVIRVVPRVERQEFINAGVVLYCPERRYLAAATRLEQTRIEALWPAADYALIAQHLLALERICEGAPDAGPIALLSARERFHWLTAPRSTILQPSPVHTGVCGQMDGVLDRLVAQFL